MGEDFEDRLRDELRRAADGAPELRWSPPEAGPQAPADRQATVLPWVRRARRSLVLGAAVAATAAVVAVGTVVVGGDPPSTPPAAVESPGPTPGQSPDGGGIIASACAQEVEYAGRTYLGSGPAAEQRRGRLLGEGAVPVCQDVPGQGLSTEPSRVRVHAVVGRPPQQAVWVDGTVYEVRSNG